MRTIILTLLALSAPASAAVGPLINGNQINPTTAITIATMNVTGATGLTVTNTATAGNFVGPGTGLTGTAAALSIGGNAGTATLATSATNLEGGSVGAHPYQTTSGATLFLPAMGTTGVILGNGTSAVPSTGTIAGTSNEITVTRDATGLTFATVGITSSCSAGSYLNSSSYTGGLVSGGSCTAAGTGDAVKAATQTFTGGNTFTGSVAFSSGTSFGNSVNIGQRGAYLVQNSTTALMINLNGAETVWAISDDGATQSTGCLVALSMSGTSETAFLRGTSTTTANLDMMDTATGRLSRPAIILGGAGGPGTSCVPGTPCLYGTKGWFRIQSTNTSYSPTSSVPMNFSGTRCKAVGAGSPPSITTIVGYFASTTDAAGNGWMSVGP